MILEQLLDVARRRRGAEQAEVYAVEGEETPVRFEVDGLQWETWRSMRW